MQNVITLVLGGGQGTRLYPLTQHRAKPAVPLGGKYRLIDIPLSNCINSGLNHVYVLTQFLSVSLHRHIRLTYRFDMFDGGFVELLAAQQTMEGGSDWYEGTADAVRKNLRYIEDPRIEHVLILSGDQLYRMDYRDMFRTHQQTGADVTIAGLPVGREEAGSLGIMKLNGSGRVQGFVEKPKTDEALDPVLMDAAWFEQQGLSGQGRDCMANMGIYLFDRRVLVDLLKNNKFQDFGKEVFPQSVDTHHIQMHMFDDYWEDIGTIRSFYEANISLGSSNPPFQLASSEAPIYTRPRFLPPARIQGATVTNSLIADGCSIGRGSVIENSLIGLRCSIGPNVTIRDSVIFGVDTFEIGERTWPPTEESAAGKRDPISIGIGANSVIEGAIVDKNVRTGPGVQIVNAQGVEHDDGNGHYMIRDGIPIILKDSTIPEGWRIS